MLQDGKERKVRVALQSPQRLVPVHICGRPPSYFILGGLVFTQVPILDPACVCACAGPCSVSCDSLSDLSFATCSGSQAGIEGSLKTDAGALCLCVSIIRAAHACGA